MGRFEEVWHSIPMYYSSRSITGRAICLELRVIRVYKRLRWTRLREAADGTFEPIAKHRFACQLVGRL